jgi:hypothetical protein
MPNRRKDVLLPGVKEIEAPPVAVFDPRRTLVKARRRAAFQDVFDLLLLSGVDWFFIAWPRTHIPFFSRHDSLTILVAINLLFVIYVVASRKLPEWRARRIASTWAPAERSKFKRA